MVHAKQDPPHSSCLDPSPTRKAMLQKVSTRKFPFYLFITMIRGSFSFFSHLAHVHWYNAHQANNSSTGPSENLPTELFSPLQSPPNQRLAPISILLARQVPMTALLDPS